MMWLPVADFEELYQVSDRGEVRSPRGALKPWLDHGGYPTVSLWKCNRKVSRAVHRLVLEAFVGPRPPEQEACHGPGGKQDNRWPENLRWDTHSWNNGVDKVRDGTSNLGERNGQAKLTQEGVCAIRELLSVETPLPQRKIAQMFGISVATVSDIKHHRTW